MNTAKRKNLESKGFKVGSVKEFLHLSDEESTYIEMKLALSKQLKQQRIIKNLSQIQVAQLLRSSQSRVAKMEAGDPSVSIDLLIRSLLTLGSTRKNVSQVLMP